jgi:hypothetical protein
MSHNIVQKANGDTSLQESVSSVDVLTLKKIGGVYPNYAGKVSLFDDFLGDVLEDGWSGAAGNDNVTAAPAISAAASGVVRLTTGDAGSGTAADASSLTHALNWKAANGDLVMEARFKVSAITTVAFFVGFTDVLATTTLEFPITLATTSFTTNATDAVGFVFDTAATTDTIRAIGVANDVDSSSINTSVAPVADTFLTVRVEVTSGGVGTFYINDVSYGSLSGVVTTSVALTPIIIAEARSTSSRTLDIDYIWVSQSR